MDVLGEALNLLAAASRDERLQFFKRFVNILPATELNDAKTIVRRVRRRELVYKPLGTVKEPVDVPQPVTVPQPSTALTAADRPGPDAEPETNGWWTKWTGNGNCMALDVEKVSVPVDPSQCYPVSFWKDGILNVTFKHKIEGMKVKYRTEAAIVAICDYDGNTVMENEIIQHEPFSFKVDKYTFGVNGIRHNSLIKGSPLEAVKAYVEKLLETNLFVAIRAENDFDSIGQIKLGDYDTFDLNSHWYRVTATDSHQCIGLNAIYKEYFRCDLQSGQHTALVDAKGTMEIFRLIYPKEKKHERNSKQNSYPYEF